MIEMREPLWRYLGIYGLKNGLSRWYICCRDYDGSTIKKMVYFDVAYDWMMVATAVGTWECALLYLSFPALISSSPSKIAFSFFSNCDIQVSHDDSDFM